MILGFSYEYFKDDIYVNAYTPVTDWYAVLYNYI